MSLSRLMGYRSSPCVKPEFTKKIEARPWPPFSIWLFNIMGCFHVPMFIYHLMAARLLRRIRRPQQTPIRSTRKTALSKGARFEERNKLKAVLAFWCHTAKERIIDVFRLLCFIWIRSASSPELLGSRARCGRRTRRRVATYLIFHQIDLLVEICKL